QFISHGEKSTLEKEELLSPNNIEYIMKYPRKFDGSRVNWEDINEVIGAKIAQLLGIKTVEAEVAYRNEKRGCLMLHFLRQYEADHGEPGAPLLVAQFDSEYDELQAGELKNLELVIKSFSLIERFDYFPIIKADFLMMNVFDIFICNQDRHPYNCQLLFREKDDIIGTVCGNGASLGWQLDDDELEELQINPVKMNKYYKVMIVKAGLLGHTQPRLKATQVLSYCSIHYPDAMNTISQRLEQFNIKAYNQYIDQFPLVSDIRKKFLKQFLEFLLNKI